MDHENLTRAEMLDILEELVLGEHIWRNSKNDLLNFIEDLREPQPMKSVTLWIASSAG